jgi:glycine oxidase
VAPERHDAVVVGGGLIGLAVAWRATQRGLDVAVLERGEPGAAASAVGAGILAPVSETTAGRPELAELAAASADAYPAFADELADVDYRRCGSLRVARDEHEVAALRELEEQHRARGLAAEWLDEPRARRLEPGLGRCVGALHVPGDAQVDPRTLTRALVTVLGGAVEAGREVTGILVDGERVVGVRTARGPVHADHVVVAAGAWSGALAWLPPQARPPVRPVKGQLAILRSGRGERPAERVVWTADVYAATRGDGRVVVGGTVEDADFDATVTADAIDGLRAAAAEALPALAEYELVEACAALRPASADGKPLIGPGAIDGLLLATGHFRHGILLAPVTADAVAALLAGDDPGPLLAPFAPTRFDARTPTP